jgi:hypothetical protein
MFMATSFFGICFLGFVFGDSLPILTFSEIFNGDVKPGDIKPGDIKPGYIKLGNNILGYKNLAIKI